MKLNEFVKETLMQIIAGVEGAQKDLAGGKACVNPQNITVASETEKAHAFDKQMGGFYTPVEFDVAVTAVESSGGEGGLRVGWSVFGAGKSATHLDSTSEFSRIRFRVVVRLPQGEPVSEDRLNPQIVGPASRGLLNSGSAGTSRGP